MTSSSPGLMGRQMTVAGTGELIVGCAWSAGRDLVCGSGGQGGVGMEFQWQANSANSLEFRAPPFLRNEHTQSIGVVAGMSGSKLAGSEAFILSSEKSSDSRLHIASLALRVSGTSVWVVDAAGVSAATTRQQLVSDACRILERKGGARVPFGQVLSFGPVNSKHFQPRSDLARTVQHSLSGDGLFLWDTSRLEGGYRCPAQCKECGARQGQGEGLIVDSFVDLARPLFAEGGKFVYLYGRKLRCNNTSRVLAKPHLRSSIHEVALTSVIALAQAKCIRSGASATLALVAASSCQGTSRHSSPPR